MNQRLPDTPEIVAVREFCRRILEAFPGAIIRLVERKTPAKGSDQ